MIKYMKLRYLLGLMLLGGLLTFSSSCSKKTGCPMNEQIEVDLDDPRHDRNRARSGLFPRR